jgi:riboflavin biosynthesis pyrimidine reductase
VAGPDAPEANAAILEANGVRVLRPRHLADGLALLRRDGVESRVCEGGGALGAKLLADGLVVRLYWVQARVWLGELGVPAFPGVPSPPIAEAPRWIPVARQALGPDTLLVLDRRLCLPVS